MTHVTPIDPHEELSPWWARAVALTFILGFGVLILLTFKAYQNAPPVPDRAVDVAGDVVFTGDDVRAGQEVFLKYGLMNNGSVWGHGAYLGPDFGAEVLHNWALDLAERRAQARFAKSYEALAVEERAAIDGEVASLMKVNRYDAATGTLTLLPAGAETFSDEIARWKAYFENPELNGGLKAKLITDPKELHNLTAFFVWAAWGSVAQRPDTTHSYTNNFPYDPLAGNHPTGAALLWTAISFIALLGGIAIVLLAFGKFDYLGWHGAPAPVEKWVLSDAQKATLKYMAVASVLLLGQTFFGAGVAHYRADPGSFYGIDLAAYFPSNLLRTWHLQSAIFWIATSYVAGALFVAELLGRESPPKQALGIHLLFGAIAAVIVGSMLGEWIGILQWLPTTWFWFGNQGWEFLELGRFWQILLAIGLLFWFFLIWRAIAPARRNPAKRGFANFFLIAAFAIPLFYLPALFFGSQTNYTIVDAWRFWIIHLWVEGFFEFFVTVIVAVIFYEMGLVRRITALRTIYLDAILYFGGGLIGTGHHWYWTGQTEVNMAFSAVFSALEVVPLTLITLDAWDFVKATRGTDSMVERHRWTFYFLMAVGFWNFLGAGVFGFLINTPIISYYEVGTILTPNHGHAAMMGVFGMLGAGLMVFVLREIVADEVWPKLQRLVRLSFWGLNIGLAMMVFLSLFPGGVMQVLDVIANGYWHARSLAYTATPLARTLEWLRMPGDLVFMFLGALPLAAALGWGYISRWRATGDAR
ncbi:MAG: nitric-oxide reductase large subunit [Parvibaculum sp.]|uniref:nitric-oxide reductase large subunit n=1 Tax=Parvibaculum sp. TaxID=2024848 RepID=UPI003C707B0B